MGRFTLFKKKECWTATWTGRLLEFFLFLLIIWIYTKTAVPFLAPYDPVQARILVVEGFLPDFALEEAMHIFEEGNYETMIITGKKRLKGSVLDQYPNDGAYSAATLSKLGIDPARIRVIAVKGDVMKDRTYQTAVAAHEWMKKNKMDASQINLVSLGCHSRRSRLLFEKAFDDSTRIGIIAIHNPSYDMNHWWRNSHGFREVTKESIAWIYARFLFYP